MLLTESVELKKLQAESYTQLKHKGNILHLLPPVEKIVKTKRRNSIATLEFESKRLSN